MGKLNFIKIKNVCSVEDTIERMKKQTMHWGEKCLPIIYLLEGLQSEYITHLKLSSKTTNNQIKI